MDRTSKLRTSQNKKKSKKREDFKVVYISSPVKVKTCASNFKTLVQELTGRHSDLSRFVETNHNHSDHDHDHKQYLSVVDLVAGGGGAGDEIDSSTTSGASSEANYQMDEESGQMMFDGLSPFQTNHSMYDVDGLQNYYYIPTF